MRQFSQHIVASHGGQVLRINPREPAIAASMGVSLACGALEALTALAALAQDPA